MVATTSGVFQMESVNPVNDQRSSLLDQYLSYAEAHGESRVFWYVKVILIMPNIFMAISICLMALITSYYLWFVGLSMILFFANVVAHISQVESRIYVPLYHATIAFMILVPVITYFNSL